MRPKIHMMQHVVFQGCILLEPKSITSRIPPKKVLRLSMQHQLEDPECMWVLNPHSVFFAHEVCMHYELQVVPVQ